MTLDTLAEIVSWDEKRKPTDATKILINKTYTEFCKQTPFWQVQNTSTETGFKGPKLEALISVNFRGQMAPRSYALQHPEAPFIMQYAIQICEVSFGRAWIETEMVAALNRGPHPSVRTQDAIAAF